MQTTTTPTTSRTPHLKTAIALAVVALVVVPAMADDRDLFRQQADSPYVFTLLDTSGSMHSTLSGYRTDGSGDSPHSRLYQEKSALYEVIKELDPGIRLGWAHFNQEDMEVYHKHWLYKRKSGQSNPPWWNRVQFPRSNRAIEFGQAVVDGGNQHYRYCGGETTSLTAVERFPKNQAAGTTTSRIYYRNSSGRYRITVYGQPSGQLGDAEIDVTIKVEQRRYSWSCSSWINRGTRTFTFVPYYTQDLDGIPFEDSNGDLGFDYLNYYNHPMGTILDLEQDYVCSSTEKWDPNNNSATGYGSDGVVAYTTYSDPLNRDPTSGALDRGDVIPWDWEEHPIATPPATGFEFSSHQEILYRLAPNTAVPGEYKLDSNGEPIPDFRSARYFTNTPSGGELQLRPQFARFPPIVAENLTPLAGMMDNLADWYEVWDDCAKDDDKGDPAFDCRNRFAILLTDGFETCGGNPGTKARRLRLLGIRVFVIGFGGGVTAGSLQSIANEGGTGNWDTNGNGITDCQEFDTPGFSTCPGPVLASNKQALIDALKNIFDAIKPKPATFSAAAVPVAEVDTEDSIFLSSFLPLPERSWWEGTVRHFLRPVPFTTDADGKLIPDHTKVCGASEDENCMAWDAGQVMVGASTGSIRQAPYSSEVTTDLRVGRLTDERRIFYSRERAISAPNEVPRNRRLFTPPSSTSLKYDLWDAFDIDYIPGNSSSEAAAAAEALQVIRDTVVIKEVPHPITPSVTIETAIGDAFHSDPVLVGTPERPEYLRFNTHGYRDFVEKHERRRKVVVVGANDGMIHAYDAGRFDQDEGDYGEYDHGTGQEVFAYMPRLLMEKVKESTQQTFHTYKVDGSPEVDDVFIDPLHNGTPTPDDREWRTVVIGGFREGGIGYYALDMTQPDKDRIIDGEHVPDDDANYLPSCLASPDTSLPTECGTIPYGVALWEFDDTTVVGGVPVPLDEDGNGSPDLGETWSRPNTGRIRVLDDAGNIEERFVAVFGGGMDPGDSGTGNFLYLVDIETGKTIYKRALDSAVPSGPAAVDTTNDGFIDKIYIGTIDGILYKVDLSALVGFASTAYGPRITHAAWTPYEIFDTLGRSLFYPPSVVFTAGANRYALAFGTGYREDLWSASHELEEGRFYVVLDDNFTTTPSPPLTDGTFQEIDVESLTVNDKLLFTDGGYQLNLTGGEKMVAPAFTITGVTLFNTFSPDVEIETVSGDILCLNRGGSRLYAIFTSSGNTVRTDSRYDTVEGIVNRPFTETDVSHGDDDGDPTNDPPSPDNEVELEQMMNEIMEFFPEDCRFSNVTIKVKTTKSDTGIVTLVEVPICVRQMNWGDLF